MPVVETAKTTKRCYSVFGLRVASRIAMPKLTPVEHRGDAPVDVQIDFGTVEPPPDGQRIAARDEALVLDYPPARFRIEAGQTITIEPNPGSSERDIRTFVLGSAFGAICHQRGLLPLHANVVEIDGRAVAFVGPSGAGKSTLAANFHRLGRHVLCDDVCALSFRAEGPPLIWPGLRRIKLWDDALEVLGCDADGLERLLDGMAKFSLTLASDPPGDPAPLERIYVPRRADGGAGPRISRLRAPEAIGAIIDNIYRWEFVAPLGKAKAQFANALAVSKTCTVYAAPRLWGFDAFDREAERLARRLTRVQRNG